MNLEELKIALEDKLAWQCSMYCLRHKETGQEIWMSNGFAFFGFYPERTAIKLNVIQKWILHGKAKRIRKYIKKIEKHRNEKETIDRMSAYGK